MAYVQQDDTQYLDPVTGQYYTKQIYQPINNGFGNIWGNGIGGGYSPYGMGGMYGNPMMNMPREIRRNTGDISQVWKLMQNRQPYQYNVPTLASLFPTLSMPAMNNTQPAQYTGGAGQFLGGLLGSMPAPTGATSSGAGRFA